MSGTAPGDPADSGGAGTGPASGSKAGSGRPVLDQVRAILAEVTGNEKLGGTGADVPLFGTGVGLDSLTGTLLLREIRRRLGVDVAAEDLSLDSLATLGTLAAFVEARNA